MKKVLAALLTIMILCTSFSMPVMAAPTASPVEMKGVWISFLDYQSFLKGKTEADFTATFSGMCDKAVAQGCNALIVHVRSHNDAIYPSAIYPWSVTMTGGNPGYDPLNIMVSTAHVKGLQFHAWINPYGYRNGVYSGNAALATQANIVAGVAEIVNKYPVDGIHFDDYFPPLGAAAHNAMIQQVYSTAHAAGKVFGISPQGNIENNTAMGADVKTWLSTPGYVDYVCPQIYWTDHYGAAGNVAMFSNRLAQWTAMDTAGIPLYVGLASYRAGQISSSDPGWRLGSNNLQSQASQARANGWSGYFIYNFSSLYSPSAATELANLKNR